MMSSASEYRPRALRHQHGAHHLADALDVEVLHLAQQRRVLDLDAHLAAAVHDDHGVLALVRAQLFDEHLVALLVARDAHLALHRADLPQRGLRVVQHELQERTHHLVLARHHQRARTVGQDVLDDVLGFGVPAARPLAHGALGAAEATARAVALGGLGCAQRHVVLVEPGQQTVLVVGDEAFVQHQVARALNPALQRGLVARQLLRRTVQLGLLQDGVGIVVAHARPRIEAIGAVAALGAQVRVALPGVARVGVVLHLLQRQAVGLYRFDEGLHLAVEVLHARAHLAPVALLGPVEVVGLCDHAALRLGRVDHLLPAVVAVLDGLDGLAGAAELGQADAAAQGQRLLAAHGARSAAVCRAASPSASSCRRRGISTSLPPNKRFQITYTQCHPAIRRSRWHSALRAKTTLLLPWRGLYFCCAVVVVPSAVRVVAHEQDGAHGAPVQRERRHKA